MDLLSGTYTSRYPGDVHSHPTHITVLKHQKKSFKGYLITVKSTIETIYMTPRIVDMMSSGCQCVGWGSLKATVQI